MHNENQDTPAQYSILRLASVKLRTGLSRSSIYLRVAEGDFPKPIHLGPRSIGWVDVEIQQWLEQRIEASRNLQLAKRRCLAIAASAKNEE